MSGTILQSRYQEMSPYQYDRSGRIKFVGASGGAIHHAGHESESGRDDQATTGHDPESGGARAHPHEHHEGDDAEGQASSEDKGGH